MLANRQFGHGVDTVDPALSRASVAKSHILVVEDDRSTAFLLQRFLIKDGFGVTLRGSAEEALECLKTKTVDLILLDIGLPGMDGYQACRILKEDPRYADIPVLFLTAQSDEDSLVRAFEAGGADYMPKPVRPKSSLTRVHTQLRISELLTDQKDMILRLEKANETKNKFLGIAAHDLRNPISAIRGMAEMILEEDSAAISSDGVEMLQSIASTAHHMLGLIEELLDVSVIEAGEQKVSLTPLNLVELLKQCLQSLRIIATRKGTQLTFSEPPENFTTMICPRTFRQVVENLIGNAVKFSPPGSKVEIVLRRDGEYCLLSVVDEGPGIPEDEQGKLFQDFSKTSNRPTGGENSTGLGLAITKRIIDAHHGKIVFRNRTDRSGGVFEVLLPRIERIQSK